MSFANKFLNKYRKQALDTRINVSKKAIHKVIKVRSEFLRNKIADVLTKSKDDEIMKTKPVIYEDSRNVDEIIIPPEKREEILSKLRQVL